MQHYMPLITAVAGAIAGALIGIAGGTAGDLTKKGKPVPSWVGRMFLFTTLLGVLTMSAGILGTVLQGNGFQTILVGCIIIVVTHYTKRGI